MGQQIHGLQGLPNRPRFDGAFADLSPSDGAPHFMSPTRAWKIFRTG
jgi:hypothetical protein